MYVNILIHNHKLVIPIQNSILYIEPIYLTTNNENSLPEVVRIVVAYKDKIVMAKTLDEALSQLFGTDFESTGPGSAPSGSEPSGGNDTAASYNEIVQQIKAAYQNAKMSAQQGEWADYGAYMDELEKAINQLGKTTSTDTADDNTTV